jgi:hydrogenase maturation protein HypF
VDAAPVIKAAAGDVLSGVGITAVAARFHNAVVAMVAEVARLVRDAHSVNAVALSGGCFLNLNLATGLRAALGDAGFTVLTHSRVPTNDGGLSLGQAAVALARLRREQE